MPNDIEVQALISLGVDSAKAREIVTATEAARKGLESAEKQAAKATAQLRQMAEQGAKLREVGSVIAGAGAALLAPFIASAELYKSRFAGIEKSANDYTKAQQRSIDASAALGRVAATALVPILNQVADVTERIAAFAAANPALVNVAIGGGAALVAGGGALIAAGTAISSMAKAAELLAPAIAKAKEIAIAGLDALKTSFKDVNALGGIGKSIVAIGALAAGAVIAEKGLNLFGKAAGDAHLETFKLADALKTVREILVIAILGIGKAFVDAKVAVGRLQDTFVGIASTVGVKIASIVDGIATNFRKITNEISGAFKNVINGIIELIASVVEKIPGQGNTAKALRSTKAAGPSASELNAGEDAGFSKRESDRASLLNAVGIVLSQNEADRQKQAAVDSANLAKLADFGAKFANTGTLGPLVDGLSKTFGQAISGILGAGKGGGAASGSGVLGVNPEGVKAFIEFRKQQQDVERQNQQALKELRTNFNDSTLKAEIEKSNQVKKLNQDYFRSELKANEDFRRTEALETRKAAIDRKRLLEDTYDNLFDAASNNDVSGFIRIQRDSSKQLRRQAEDASEADRQRVDEYNRARQEAALNLKYQTEDLNKNFDDQAKERQREYDRQRSELIVKQGQEKTLRDQAFAEQLASLQGNIAGLQDIQNAYYQTQGAAFQQYLDANASKLQDSIKALQSGASGGSTVNLTSPSLSSGVSSTAGFGNTPIIRSSDVNSSGGPSVTVDLRGAVLSGGATQADLAALEGRVYTGVGNAWKIIAGATR